MRTFAIALGLVAFAGAVVAHADTMKLEQAAYSFDNGGEFKMTPVDPLVSPSITGDVSAITSDSFETFCLEHGEDFTPGNIYNVTYNTVAIHGGTGDFDPLDPRTAYLYTQFRNETLTGYDFSTPDARKNSAGDLQKAIWYIEDEDGGVNNAFVALADAAILPGGDWYNVGLGNVLVLNLTDDAGGLHQDQLTLVAPDFHIPSPGGVSVLLLSGLAAARRRR